MKKITFFLILLSLCSFSFLAQTTEVFEDDTAAATSFTHIEQTFNITTTVVSETFNITTFANGGWNGTGVDNQFIDNSGISNTGDGTNFTIKHSNTNVNFTVKELYLFCSTKALGTHSGTLTITGRKDGALVTGYTIIKNSGFSNVATFSPNNGFTHINFATEGGVDNSNKVIDELVISSTGNLDYMALDAFKFDLTTKIWDGSSSTDWATTTNWSEDVVPLSTDDVIIPNITNKPIISSSTGAVANDITIDASSSVTVNGGGSLIIDGTANVNGDFIYKVNVADTNWHLVSSPVVNEQYDDTWNDANGIDTSGAGNNEAVASYTNTSDVDGDWVYFQDGGSATTFGSGTGYSLKRTIAGDYTFVGTFPPYPVNATISANDINGSNQNRWTLVGNPSPAYINIATFLSVNTTPLTDTHESIYVWNASSGEYQDLQTGFIHPGQGFFVSSNVASTSVTFTKAMQSDQNGVIFYKTSHPKITLSVYDGTNTKSTEINYLEGKTTTLDPGFDIGTFTGQSSSFSIYSHLVSNSEGVDFKRQALPNRNFEDMIIPIGVKAIAGEEIIFSLEALNFPSDLKVFLEDRQTSTFTRLDQANSTYKTILTNPENGIGRFYLRTTSSVLNIDNNATFDKISVYTLNEATLRISGLFEEPTEVSVFNLLGKKILSTSFVSNGIKDISLPNISKGVYLVKLTTNTGKLNKKIILE